MKRFLLTCIAAALAGLTVAQQIPSEFLANRKPSLVTGGNCLIKNARVYTITNGTFDGDILIRNGKIAGIGKDLVPPDGIKVIDATGKIVLPGLIDAHSHRGESETNEWADSISADVSIADVIWPEQEGLYYNLANGITSALVLHGSSNAIGGQSVVIKSRYRHPANELPFVGAPRMIKFALGENVTQKFDVRSTRYPKTRMGVESVYRRAFADAKAYMKLWDDYNANPAGTPPRKDVRLEALADILRGKIWVQCHSYRQDEMLMMVRLSQEFGFKIGAMQHALEGYKIAPELAEAHVPVSQFGEAWAYKAEVMDSIPMSAALCVKAGVLTSVNTDTFSGLVALTQDAGRELRYGLSEDEAMRLVTINPAKQLGIDKYVGSIEVGKDADISIWDGHPLSTFAKCSMTLIDGEVCFQRRDAFGVDANSTIVKTVKSGEQTADLAAPIQWAERYAIVGATVHPVVGPDIQNGTVLIEKGKIVGVGGPELFAPAHSVVLLAKGLHVYPGFIDAGSDMGMYEIGENPATEDAQENGPYQPDLVALTTVNPESVRFAIARCAGITSCFVRPSGTLIGGQGAMINLAGYTREQMVIQNKISLDVYYPEGPSFGERSSMTKDDLDKRLKAVDESRLQLAEQFEAAKRYSDAKKADGSLPVEAKMEAMLPFVNAEKPVVFHVNGESGIRAALVLAKKQSLKAIIAGGRDAWKVAKLLVDRNVPVLYSAPSMSCPGETDPQEQFDPYDTPYAAGALMERAGVKFALQAGDSAVSIDLPNQAGALCAYGLSHDGGLKALTINAAEILGCADSYGSLEKGKVANVLITDGDPMEMSTHVLREFINGKPVVLKSHFTDLYRKYLKRIQGG